jgi:hypothetical protein
MTRAQKMAEKYEAATYYESSLLEDDVNLVDDFMLSNRVSPDEVVFLSQMEAGWSDTTLLEIKAKLDRYKIANMLWYSHEEGEDRLIWSVQE